MPAPTSALTSRVVVTGAAGRHGGTGGTGGTVIRLLLGRGVPVRALVRRDDARAAALRAAGAEVVVADLLDHAAVTAACAGVGRAYFCYPVDAGVTDATVAFAGAARAAGVGRVIHSSMPPTHPASPSPLGRAQWRAERVLRWSGLPTVHLRAAFVDENLPRLAGPGLAGPGLAAGDAAGAGTGRRVLRDAFGAARLAWVAADDVDAVLATLPPGTMGRGGTPPDTLPLTGDGPWTMDEAAAALAEDLGTPVTREALDPAARAAARPAVAPPMPLADTVRVLTGATPRTLADVVAARPDVFPAAAPASRAAPAGVL